MSHRKFEHPRHGSVGFLPRKRANRPRGKGPSLLSCSNAYIEIRLKCVFNAYEVVLRHFGLLFVC